MNNSELVQTYFKTELVAEKVTDNIALFLYANKIFFTYIRKHTLIDMKIVAEISEFLGEQVNEPLYNIVEFEPFSEAIDESRVWAAGQTNERFSFGDAFIINNLPHKILIDSYLKQNRPKFPTRVFASTEDSFEWIADLMKVNANAI